MNIPGTPPKQSRQPTAGKRDDWLELVKKIVDVTKAHRFAFEAAADFVLVDETTGVVKSQ
jgi:hypothetical protein